MFGSDVGQEVAHRVKWGVILKASYCVAYTILRYDQMKSPKKMEVP